MYLIGQGHNIPKDDLVPIVPQPASPGVEATRRIPTEDDWFEDGLFVVLQWSASPNTPTYQAVLTQHGILAVKIAPVTVWARDDVWNWARYNGYAEQPRVGQRTRWDNFYINGTTILIKELELLEEP